MAVNLFDRLGNKFLNFSNLLRGEIQKFSLITSAKISSKLILKLLG
ncbi:hypothetical protein KMP11_00505 [Gemella sp. zg-570]|nr:hypothetical protein [Gemella sp. zg-570]QWQ38883.1 hypothetical protein KMP11_00505 [Gemella sp. zg-570]